MPAGPCLRDVIRSVRETAEWCVAVAISIFMLMRWELQKVLRCRSRWCGLAFTSAKPPTSEKAMCPVTDASVKSIDAVLGKVRLPYF